MAFCAGDRILERIRKGERLLSDGGMGSELIRLGVAPEETLKINLSRPQIVGEIHRSYLAAGAQVQTANTFGLWEEDLWADMVGSGAAIALEIAGDWTQEVGVWLSFPGSVLPSRMETLRSLKARAARWPDALLIETCVSLPQAMESLQAAKLLAPSLLAVTCHFRADGRMPDGTTPEAAAQTLTQAGADIVGGNCGDTPESFIEVDQRMRAATDFPLLFQPSAGLPSQQGEGRWIYPVGPEPFAEIAIHLFAAGVDIVGGCCGTTPQYIQSIESRLNR